MRYFDTSFLVPLVLPEATSDPIARLFEGLLAEDLAVSHWTRVKFASMFARVVRMGKPDAVAAHDAGSRFDAMTEEPFIVLLSDHVDFDRDREWFCRFETGLGTGEAPASCHGEQPLSGGNPLPRQGLISAGTKPGSPRKRRNRPSCVVPTRFPRSIRTAAAARSACWTPCFWPCRIDNTTNRFVERHSANRPAGQG